MSYTHVDKPIRIGNIEIKNRTFRPAHGTGIGLGWMNDALIAYHEERARGGVGLIINEVGSVHPSTALLQNIYDPNIEGGMRKLVDRIKPHGTRLFQQLWHGGHYGGWDGSVPWSSSDIPNVEAGVVPVRMSKAMIDEIIGSFAECAYRMEQYGLDGVDVHCAHGYLFHQFLSPLTNDREDEYGGSFENRLRFTIEVMKAIRSAVSANFVVGVRIGPDLAPGGIGIEETLRVARTLEDQRLIDYVNVSVGNYCRNDKMIGGMNEPPGYELSTSAPITHNVKIPTLITGRFRTLEEIDQVIRAGDADMVGLVRAMIADPRLVSKSLAGDADRVRPCIACNQACVANQVRGLPIECAVNPGAGHELERGDHMLERAPESRVILVVGGGPAGLEAARVAAIRGHKVILAEANSYLGGSIRTAAKVPTRHTLVDIVTWLEEEVYRLGVDVRLNTYLDAADVHEIRPDAVIIATGAMERMDGIQSSHLGEPIKNVARKGVISSTELFMATPAELGRSAVVIDDVGHFEGLGAAEFLINQGLEVTYITPRREVGPLARQTLMVEPYLQRMQGKPFRYMIRTRAIAIEQGEVVVGPAYLFDTLADSSKVRADTVVLVSHNRPNRDVYDALVGQIENLHVVGDAASPRFLQTAIREGHIAGKSV
ncbi:oxidoreductase [Paraburkholderia rhynchosiae]|nr:FAD-dependent oxidoreductase [Paraburkholderia rhynchosiae]CAB3735910.1 Metal reductase [Paraburkholderia rhynchosiae]